MTPVKIGWDEGKEREERKGREEVAMDPTKFRRKLIGANAQTYGRNFREAGVVSDQRSVTGIYRKCT